MLLKGNLAWNQKTWALIPTLPFIAVELGQAIKLLSLILLL